MQYSLELYVKIFNLPNSPPPSIMLQTPIPYTSPPSCAMTLKFEACVVNILVQAKLMNRTYFEHIVLVKQI